MSEPTSLRRVLHDFQWCVGAEKDGTNVTVPVADLRIATQALSTHPALIGQTNDLSELADRLAASVTHLRDADPVAFDAMAQDFTDAVQALRALAAPPAMTTADVAARLCQSNREHLAKWPLVGQKRFCGECWTAATRIVPPAPEAGE